MKIYTYQLAKWRSIKRKRVPMLDTTIKSGEELLAPTWGMVIGHKKGVLSDEQYEELYFELLAERYVAFPDFFEWLVSRDVIALGCYCPAGKFCHRLLIVKFLKEITEVDYLVEIE